MMEIGLDYSIKAVGASGLTLASIIVLSEEPLLLFATLSTILIILMISDRRIPMTFYILIGVGGLLMEGCAIWMGVDAWSYKQKQFGDAVPYWLLPMWGIIGSGVLGIYALLR